MSVTKLGLCFTAIIVYSFGMMRLAYRAFWS